MVASIGLPRLGHRAGLRDPVRLGRAQLFVITAPLGIVAAGIAFLRGRAPPRGPYNSILFPFARFADLHATYVAAGNFRKHRYPRKPAERVPSPLARLAIPLQIAAAFLILGAAFFLCAPLALFFEMFPTCEREVRVAVFCNRSCGASLAQR
jgi:hypothetical protein